MVPDALARVVCAFRSVEGLPLDASAGRFIDLRPDDEVDQDARQRLVDLRARLRATLGSAVQEYGTRWSSSEPATEHVDQFCAGIQARLWSLIEAQIISQASRDALTEESEAHWSFAAERVREAVGMPAQTRRTAAVEYIADASRAPLVVTGPAGVGKSTWAAQTADHARSLPNTDVFLRFVGVSADSAYVPTLLTGLAAQVARHYGLDEPIAATYDKQVAELWSRLAAVPAGRSAVVIVDGVDLLGSGNDTRLDWLPARLPENVRLIVTTAPGPTLDGLLELPGRHVLELAPLGREEAGTILDRWLTQRGRTLQPAQRRSVLDRFASNGLPLYLRLATEEVVRWRSDAPESELDLAADVGGIIRGLFTRLSSESEHGAMLVSRTLACIACGKNGLAEHELLSVLTADADVTPTSDVARRARRLRLTCRSSCGRDCCPTWRLTLADGGVTANSCSSSSTGCLRRL